MRYYHLVLLLLHERGHTFSHSTNFVTKATIAADLNDAYRALLYLSQASLADLRRYQARMQREQSGDAAPSDAGRPQNTWAESVSPMDLLLRHFLAVRAPAAARAAQAAKEEAEARGECHT